jgi:hypothetical protein
MSYNNRVLFYLLFIIYLFLEIESFTPIGRLAHSSVLVENKLYFFGGAIDGRSCSNEVFYLDVSQPFNIHAMILRQIPVYRSEAVGEPHH